jgi:hypothetical protein
MKEQIRQFERQSNIDVYGLGLDRVKWEAALEKFTELIVHDIINVLESEHSIRHVAYTTYDLGTVESTIEKSINAITEHYGMKQHIRIKNERTLGRKISSK